MLIRGELVSCEGKERFAEFNLARKVARRFDGKMAVYKCQHCKGFHIGSELRTIKHAAKRKRITFLDIDPEELERDAA